MQNTFEIDVNTYHPLMPKIHRIIWKNWSFLTRSYPKIEEFQHPLLICSKRPPNLHNSLVQADIGPIKRPLVQRSIETDKTGTYPCLHCAHCTNTIKGNFVTHPRTGKHIPIKGFFTCNSAHVVYLLKCPCDLIRRGNQPKV